MTTTATRPAWQNATAPQFLALRDILVRHGITAPPTRGVGSVTEPLRVPLRSTRTRRQMLDDLIPEARQRRIEECRAFSIDLDVRDDIDLHIGVVSEDSTWAGEPFDRWVNHHAHQVPAGYEVLVDGVIMQGVRPWLRDGETALAALGAARTQAVAQSAAAMARLTAAIRDALASGMSESQAARLSGVDRMTVRKIAGK